MITATEYRAMAAEHHRHAACAGHLNPANSTCASNKNCGRWPTARNACTGRMPAACERSQIVR